MLFTCKKCKSIYDLRFPKLADWIKAKLGILLCCDCAEKIKEEDSK